MPIPTALSNESSSSSAHHQTTMVVATTGGAIVLVFTVFAAIFLHMRRRRHRRELMDTLAREERKGKGAGGVGMLDGEGFYDSVRGHYLPKLEYNCPPTEFRLNLHLTPDAEAPTQEYVERPPLPRYKAQPPFLFPPRASDSGSAFREEVWPPPRQESVFVDPLQLTPSDDLTRIVTDIMGLPDAPTDSTSTPVSSSTSTRADISSSASLAAAPRSRRNSCSTIYARTTLRSFDSTPTLPLSSLSTETRGTDSDDDPWPPKPGILSDSSPPVSYWQRPGAAKSPRRDKPQLRPSTGDGSPRIKNWLERTPRRLEPSTGVTRPRAASAGH